jgi:hypothetical protein
MSELHFSPPKTTLLMKEGRKKSFFNFLFPAEPLYGHLSNTDG